MSLSSTIMSVEARQIFLEKYLIILKFLRYHDEISQPIDNVILVHAAHA